MSDLDDILQNQADELARQEAEHKQYAEKTRKWNIASSLLAKIEHPETESNVSYADLLCSYPPVVKDVNGADSPPDLTPIRKTAAALAVEAMQFAFANDAANIVRILDHLRSVPTPFAKDFMDSLRDLCRRMLYPQTRLFGSWEVAGASNIQGQTDAVHADEGEKPEDKEGSAPSGMPWQEVAQRLEHRRVQGEKFTTCEKMGEQIGCAPSTVHKAISRTPSLKQWAERPKAAPKAQSLTPYKNGEGHINLITDRIAQSREPDPADEVRIREYLERDDLTDADRATFNSIARVEDQLRFLDQVEELQTQQAADERTRKIKNRKA